MKNTSCCFTGHRDIPHEKIPAIKERLHDVLSSLIEQGFTDFYNGGAVGFDLLSAEAVLELKKSHPHIRLHLIIPCANQTVKWKKSEIERYECIKEAADEVKILSPFYFNGCMQIRNRYMVDASSVCVAYLERTTGGSADTVKYAKQKGVAVVII